MILEAGVLLIVCGVFVLWPLLGSSQSGPPTREPADEVRRRDLEELDLDVASGRLTAEEAAGWRAETAT